MTDPRRGYNPSELPPPGMGGPPKIDPPAGAKAREGESEEAGGLAKIDVLERGAERDGAPQVMDRRLFMQLLAFDCADDHDPSVEAVELGRALDAAKVAGVVYADVNAPRGLAVLTWSEDPEAFVTRVRPLLTARRQLVLRPDLTMLGRTYSQGYEHDLAHWLIERPAETALNDAWPWAVWYPLRRSGAFAKLEPREQGKILKEHAIIGRAYGAKDLAHDIRLACHGLDARDNEFVIGLVGKSLHPLSHIVQSMRKTTQTSLYISQMGPFFVGHVAYRSKG